MLLLRELAYFNMIGLRMERKNKIEISLGKNRKIINESKVAKFKEIKKEIEMKEDRRYIIYYSEVDKDYS